jgi:hypothetical protein
MCFFVHKIMPLTKDSQGSRSPLFTIICTYLLCSTHFQTLCSSIVQRDDFVNIIVWLHKITCSNLLTNISHLMDLFFINITVFMLLSIDLFTSFYYKYFLLINIYKLHINLLPYCNLCIILICIMYTMFSMFFNKITLCFDLYLQADDHLCAALLVLNIHQHYQLLQHTQIQAYWVVQDFKVSLITSYDIN